MSSTLEKDDKVNVENFEKNHSTESLEPIDAALERRVRLKCDLYLLPPLFILLLFAFLDRVNIGNARIQGLEADLGMKGTDYNVALFVFFITYITCEIPSNLILKHVRPSIYLPGLIFGWGVVSIMQGVTQSFAGLVVCRLLIGAFEAGFFPGAIYLISMYYKRYEVQLRVTIFFSGSILAGAISGLLAYGIAFMSGDGGYNSWRWIFIIEGCATCVAAVIALFVLPDWPETAKFLAPEERALLVRRLAADAGEATMAKYNKNAIMRTVKDIKIYLGILMFIGVATSSYSVAFFTPTILTQLGWTSLRAQYMSIPISCCGAVVALCVAVTSDVVKHRYGFIIFGCMLTIIGYGILLNTTQVAVAVRYMALYFITSGASTIQPIVIGWLNNNMGGHYKRGVGTAAQIGMGNIAGLIASNVYITTEAPLYKTGYSTGLSMILMTVAAATLNLFYVIWANKQRQQGKRDHLLSLPAEEVANLGDDHPSFRFGY